MGTAIGYTVALLTQLLLFSALGLHISFGENLFITTVFTVVSLIRSYWVRRLFNWMHN